MMKPEVRMDGWVVIFFGDPRLAGTVYGHPKLPDGDEIFTSPIEEWIKDGDKIRVETHNTIYNLGEFSTELRDRLERDGMKVGNTPVDPNAN